MTGRICGTGSCVPSFAMDNNDIAKLVDTSDEWIRERTGVVRRHIIKEETTVSMAVQAGRQALENAGNCCRRCGSDHRVYDFFKCNTSLYSL